MTSNNHFTVPALSLTSSRAKRHQHSNIPTKDGSYLDKGGYTSNQNDINFQLKYHHHILGNNQPANCQQQQRLPIFPQKYGQSHNNNQDVNSKDLNKNVYLQRKEQYHLPILVANDPIYESASLRTPNLLTNNGSRKNLLLTNPQSTRLIKQQFTQRIQNKKMDINRALFDRKMSKLFQQANFYEEELGSFAHDLPSKHIEQLEEIKRASLISHKDLLNGLNALICQ